MPYHKNSDLPETIKNHLPEHAQDIYREAFNHAHEEYKNPKKRNDPHESLEEVSHKVAWGVVKKKYSKGKDQNWHLKK